MKIEGGKKYIDTLGYEHTIIGNGKSFISTLGKNNWRSYNQHGEVQYCHGSIMTPKFNLVSEVRYKDNSAKNK